jgi:hypothetical protein
VLPAYGANTPITRMGDVLLAGKLYMDTQNGLDGQDGPTTRAEHLLYQWFGDPTMPIWTHFPLRYIVTGVRTSVLSAKVLQVATDQKGVDGSYVTLSRDGVPLGRGVLRGGTVNINSSRDITDTRGLTVSLDKSGYQTGEKPVG